MTRSLGIAFLLLILIVAPTAPAGAEEEKPPTEMARYFFGLIKRGPNWTAEQTEETRALQAAHRANIGRLVKEEKMVLAGPFEDSGDLRGIFVYHVPTLEEAEELVATDPAVAAGRLRVELHAWWGTADLIAMMKDHNRRKATGS